jgi:uncharacterized protein involved in copper resistance
MIRFSNLTLAAGLAILPVAAFAQPAATPVQATAATAPVTTPAVKTSTAAQPVTTGAKTAVAGTKTEAKAADATGTKAAKPLHAKLGTTAHTVPAKTAEPSKS